MRLLGATVGVMMSAAIAGAAYAGDGLAEFNKQDYAAAAKDLPPLAQQGNAQAEVDLGLMSEYGNGEPKDPTKAMQWYLKAAAQGNAQAENNIGMIYGAGDGVPKNFVVSIFWLEKAASQGYKTADYLLGLDYSNGNGVPRDPRKSANYLFKAAEAGNFLAIDLLTYDYQVGFGVPRDVSAEDYWCQKSALQGDPNGQFCLGVAYAKGRGVIQNFPYAYAMFDLASAHGPSDNPDGLMTSSIEEAGKYRDELLSLMSQSQIAEGQKIAESGVPPPITGLGYTPTPPEDLPNPSPPPTIHNKPSHSKPPPELSQADLSAIEQHVLPCWSVDSGAPGVGNFEVHLSIETDGTGTVRNAIVAPIDEGKMDDPTFNAYANRAIDAVMNYQCATLPLPGPFTGSPHSFIINFRPEPLNQK